MTRRLRRITPSEYFHAYLDGSAAYLRLSGGNIQSLCGEFLLCFMGLRQLESQPTNQGVGSSNLSGRANQSRSFPVTSLTIYTGHIADTLALKGLGAHSTRVH